MKISLNTPVTSLLRSCIRIVRDREVCVCVCACVCVCVCVCVACVCVFVFVLRFCVFPMITASSVLRGSFYQMRDIKCLKVRDLEA